MSAGVLQRCRHPDPGADEVAVEQEIFPAKSRRTEPGHPERTYPHQNTKVTTSFEFVA
jgi:hypothetical protein